MFFLRLYTFFLIPEKYYKYNDNFSEIRKKM